MRARWVRTLFWAVGVCAIMSADQSGTKVANITLIDRHNLPTQLRQSRFSFCDPVKVCCLAENIQNRPASIKFADEWDGYRACQNVVYSLGCENELNRRSFGFIHVVKGFVYRDIELETRSGYRQTKGWGVPTISPHWGNSDGFSGIRFAYIKTRKINECPIATDELLTSDLSLISHNAELFAYSYEVFSSLLIGAAQCEPLQASGPNAEKTDYYQQPSRANQTARYRYQWGFVGAVAICLGAALIRASMELFYEADKAARFSPAAWIAFLIGGGIVVHGLIYACTGIDGFRDLYLF